MDKMFKKGRAFSAHIEKKKSKCDYHFERDLTPEEIKIIEEKVNEQILLDLPVKERSRNICAFTFSSMILIYSGVRSISK